MKLFTTLPLLLFSLLTPTALAESEEATPAPGSITEKLYDDIQLDGLDISGLAGFAELNNLLSSLPENATLGESAEVAAAKRGFSSRTSTSQKIDVHTHIVPDFLRALVPTTGGNPTPSWTAADHLAFMQQQGIARSILAVSAPGSGITPGDKDLAANYARLLNLYAWAYTQMYPDKFSFYAVVPLPYVPEAIAEAKYAFQNLGAVGIAMLSNHEGLYPGNAQFNDFWQYLGTRGKKTVVYVHPNTPIVKKNGQSIEANPTLYATGLFEFYFETARAFMDLTVSGILTKYTNIHYVIPHVGGAFPAILDRFIKSFPQIEAASKAVYNTRCWWDSAGPTYFGQVKGLLGYGIPKSQLLFGTDFPYAPSFTYSPSLAAIENADFVTATEKQNIFVNNAKTLFSGIINL